MTRSLVVQGGVEWNDHWWTLVDILDEWLDGGRRVNRICAQHGEDTAIFDVFRDEDDVWRMVNG